MKDFKYLCLFLLVSFTDFAVTYAQVPEASFTFKWEPPSSRNVTLDKGGVEYYETKWINGDGTVHKVSSQSPMLVLISDSEVNTTENGSYNMRFRYSHNENGNRVYFYDVNGDGKTINRAIALVVFADKVTINTLYFVDAVSKELQSCHVYKKLTNNSIGTMYE